MPSRRRKEVRSFALDPNMVDELDQLAERTNLTVSALGRELLALGMEVYQERLNRIQEVLPSTTGSMLNVRNK